MVTELDKILINHNLEYVLEVEDMKRYVPRGTKEVLAAVKEIKEQGLKVFIDPDSDPDGFFSALIIKEMFDKIGHTNYYVNKLIAKRHGITDTLVAEIITKGFNYAFIVDSSTNDLALIQRLCDNGVKVVIIDHHESNYPYEIYPQECIMVNTRMERLIKPIPYDEVSAGMLCAMVADYVLTNLGYLENIRMYIYGYITLYSDSCDLSNKFNISVINKFCLTNKIMPPMVEAFMDTKYDGLCRSFVSYKLVPRINALIRLGHFDKVYDLFFNFSKLTLSQRQYLTIFTEDKYALAKELSLEIYLNSEQEIFDNFSIIKLDNVKENLPIDVSHNLLRNFTGLCCQSLVSLTGNPALSIISVNNDTYQGSVRDPLNRDILSIFQRLCKCGGHPSAFGFEVPKLGFSRFKKRLIHALSNLSELEGTNYHIIPSTSSCIDEQMKKISTYNEISGGKLPMIYVSKELDRTTKITQKAKYTSIKWGELWLTCFVPDVKYGDKVLIKPTLNKDKISYMVNTLESLSYE